MPLRFVRNDLTKMDVDAIVNAVSPALLDDGVCSCVRGGVCHV